MDIYQQIEKMLDGEKNRPKWADEILKELFEIKNLLLQNSSDRQNNQYKDVAYYKFIKSFRKQIQTDIANNLTIEVEYFGEKIGIDLKGFFYDLDSNKNLSAHKAHQIYRFLYENQDKIEQFVKRNVA